jgi:hypothetical protein
MIAYDLQCAKGHSFEGWFEDENAYRLQKKKGLIECPVCNDKAVSKIPSTFAIKSSNASVSISAQQKQLDKISKKIIEYVDENFDDVGSNFAKEALKIHYGVSEPRNIKGVSTEQEEETLKKEGIDFFKIPVPNTPDTDA